MAQIRKILCAVDFSDTSKQVVDYVLTLSRAFEAEIKVLYVAPSLTQYVGFHVPPTSIENFVGEIVAGAEKSMDVFIEEHFTGARAEGHVSTGYAAEEILAYADQTKVDMIVMGTHGRKGIDRILFGSVAEKVVKSAPMPVLTVRPE